MFMVGFPKIKMLMVEQSGWARVRRESFLFTACHSGKLKLTFTSPDVISTSCKNFLTSRTDFTVILNLSFEFLKKHQFTSPIAKSTSPELLDTTFFARWWALYLIEHFFSLKDKNELVSEGY